MAIDSEQDAHTRHVGTAWRTQSDGDAGAVKAARPHGRSKRAFDLSHQTLAAWPETRRGSAETGGRAADAWRSGARRPGRNADREPKGARFRLLLLVLAIEVQQLPHRHSRKRTTTNTGSGKAKLKMEKRVNFYRWQKGIPRTEGRSASARVTSAPQARGLLRRGQTGQITPPETAHPYPRILTITVETSVYVNVLRGNTSQATASGLRMRSWRGPLRQIATNTPPGSRSIRARWICLISCAC